MAKVNLWNVIAKNHKLGGDYDYGNDYVQVLTRFTGARYLVNVSTIQEYWIHFLTTYYSIMFVSMQQENNNKMNVLCKRFVDMYDSR